MSKIPNQLYRDVIDYRLQGRSYRRIAQLTGLSIPSVKALLTKLRTNYTENGERQSPLERLIRGASKLDLNREPTPADKLEFVLCKEAGRIQAEIAYILFLEFSKVCKLWVEFEKKAEDAKLPTEGYNGFFPDLK